jgi:hypothetical protein
MHCSQKEKKLLPWLLVLCLIIATQYSVYAFDPVVPQERLNDIVNIGTITPTQFEELDEATIQAILARSDVQSLLQNHFELLGLYGETAAGLILKTPEAWSRFGEHVALSGTTLQKVYDTWYREKIQNQPELLTGEVADMEAFFEKHFSSTEENRLADGRDINWETFAYERGLPIAAGILFVLYQAWWRKRKEDPDEDWGGLEDIYQEKFENNNANYGAFYAAARSDNRIYSFQDWYPRMWTFWQKANAQLEHKINFEKGIKDLGAIVKSYIFDRKTRQQKEFESTLQSALTELSSEEIKNLSQGKLALEDLPEFLEKEVVVGIATEETIRLEDEWVQFSNEFLTEERLTTFFEEQLPLIEDRIGNHPESVQGILAAVQTDWDVKFEAERQAEIENITIEADALYNDLIRYAVYNYQYQNVADTRAKFYAQKVKELDQILAPQKETMTTVFKKYTDSFEKKKETLEEKIQNITYRQELVEDIDYVTPIAKLFPYEEPPTPPSPETIEKVTQELYDSNALVVEKEEAINYLHVSLMAAKALYDATFGAQLAECKKLVESIGAKIKEGEKELQELEKKMDPTKNTVLNHAEVYAKEIDRRFTEELRNLEAEYQKMIAQVREDWEPQINDPDYWASARAQQNRDATLAQYKKEYEETRKTIQSYRKGAFLRKLGCIAIIEESIRQSRNKKQKEKRESYSNKRKENPAKKSVVQYLMALEDSGNNTFFGAQKSTLLQLETIQKEHTILVENLATPSPYEVEIQNLEIAMATPNYYTFEEYAEKNNIQNTSWVVKDSFLRGQDNIGRSGDYWGSKYANYAHSLMENFSSYDERAIATLRDLAQKANTEKMESYANWGTFFKAHPLQHESNYNVQKNKIDSLRVMEAERKQLINEQIATLDARVREQTGNDFISAQWLAKRPEERREDAFTDVIVEAEMNASWAPTVAPVVAETLLQHFTDVRESQHLAQQTHLNVINNRTMTNPLAFDVDVLLAPIIRQMYYNETPEGVSMKSEYYDSIVGTTESEVVIPPPVPTYQQNENGTYTPTDRATGEIITEPTFEIPVAEIVEMPEIIAEAEAIVDLKRLEVLYTGEEEPLVSNERTEWINNSLAWAWEKTEQLDSSIIFQMHEGAAKELLSGIIAIIDLIFHASVSIEPKDLALLFPLGRGFVADILEKKWKGYDKQAVLASYIEGSEEVRQLAEKENQYQVAGGYALIAGEIFTGVYQLQAAGLLHGLWRSLRPTTLLKNVKQWGGTLLDVVTSGSVNLWNMFMGKTPKLAVIRTTDDGLLRYADDVTGGAGSVFNSASGAKLVNVVIDGAYTSFDDVASYLHKYGKLPKNYITKAEAGSLGWSKGKDVNYFAKGKSIGGDIFENRSDLITGIKPLPEKTGRVWLEADINYTSGYRSTTSERILYSNDGLLFKSTNHYNDVPLMQIK